MPQIERYVPTGKYSLISDAPGWSIDTESGQNFPNLGPICWKCKGKGLLKVKCNLDSRSINSSDNENNTCKKKQKLDFDTKPCKVCGGNGSLPKKKQEMISLDTQPGMITWRRQYPSGWTYSGPKAAAIVEMERYMELSTTRESDVKDMDFEKNFEAFLLLHKAMTDKITKTEGICVPKHIISDPYPWLPVHNGEQLCNLVGSWRILQRRASHRWTTDDICTAYIAIREQKSRQCNRSEKLDTSKFNYLDLGCGNASVLQMTSWGLMEDYSSFQAFGIEARFEAVNLARRSLTFNVGANDCDFIGSSHRIFILHGDFRDIEEADPFQNSSANSNSIISKFHECSRQKFDLVTGTPPYFRVDFGTKSGNISVDKMVTSAVIHQGGMPSSIQSAPARCEFRGGIESYCIAASKVLSDDGIFVVCENWLNHDRVALGASSAGLHIKKIVPFQGKEFKPNLFAVYVLGKQDKNSHMSDTVTEDAICVRSLDGNWTSVYSSILDYMSVPTSGYLSST